MLAIDTNLIVRYLTNDHPDQSRRARTLIDSEAVFVAKTVLLETEWVLRGVYGRAKADVLRALSAFCGLARVTVEDAPVVAKALDAMGRGMDFADALHLASSVGCDVFVSFDEQFAKVARVIGGIEVRAP